jgi:hypothetical protein
MIRANRLDAAERVYFRTKLEAVDTELYEVQYPDLVARDLIPTQPGIPDWASVYTWTMLDKTGKAKIISGDASDIPRVRAKASQGAKIIKDVAASHGWTIKEIKKARATGMPLDSTEALAARYSIESEVDEILAVGNSANGLEGLLNATGIGTYTLSTKAATGTKWDTATPDEIVGDITGIVTGRITARKAAGGMVFQRYTVLLPLAAYTQIATRRMGEGEAAGSSVTILEHVSKLPYIESIVPWHRCDDVVATGRMLAYPRSRIVVAGIVPQEFEQMEPDRRGLEYVVDCTASCGGVVVRYPDAIAKADGLLAAP